MTPLGAAAATDDAGSLALLIELNAEVDARADANGARALHYCADKGSVRCAQLLLEHGAPLEATDDHGNTPLHAAGRRGHQLLFDALLAAGADPRAQNARGKAPAVNEHADDDAACAVM